MNKPLTSGLVILVIVLISISPGKSSEYSKVSFESPESDLDTSSSSSSFLSKDWDHQKTDYGGPKGDYGSAYEDQDEGVQGQPRTLSKLFGKKERFLTEASFHLGHALKFGGGFGGGYPYGGFGGFGHRHYGGYGWYSRPYGGFYGGYGGFGGGYRNIYHPGFYHFGYPYSYY